MPRVRQFHPLEGQWPSRSMSIVVRQNLTFSVPQEETSDESIRHLAWLRIARPQPFIVTSRHPVRRVFLPLIQDNPAALARWPAAYFEHARAEPIASACDHGNAMDESARHVPDTLHYRPYAKKTSTRRRNPLHFYRGRGAPPSSDWPSVLRYCRGVVPAICLNARLNRLSESNPESCAILTMRSSEVTNWRWA